MIRRILRRLRRREYPDRWAEGGDRQTTPESTPTPTVDASEVITAAVSMGPRLWDEEADPAWDDMHRWFEEEAQAEQAARAVLDDLIAANEQIIRRAGHPIEHHDEGRREGATLAYPSGPAFVDHVGGEADRRHEKKREEG